MNGFRKHLWIAPIVVALLAAVQVARAEGSGQPGAWRFSLECIRTKEKRGFDGLDELVAFLEGELESEATEPTLSMPAEK